MSARARKRLFQFWTTQPGCSVNLIDYSTGLLFINWFFFFPLMRVIIYVIYIYNVFGFCRTHQEDVVLCFRYLRRTLTNCFWHADSNIYWLIEKLISTWIDNWSNPWLQPFKKCSYSCYSDSDKRNITLRRLKRANFEHFALKIDFTPNWLSKSWWSTDWFSSTPYSK